MRRNIYFPLAVLFTIISGALIYFGFHGYMAFGIVGFIIFGLVALRLLNDINSIKTGYMAFETFRGRRTGKFVREGLTLLPLKGTGVGYDALEPHFKYIDINHNFKPQTVQTPDLGELILESSMRFRVDLNEIERYFFVGGEEGVIDQIKEMKEGALREFYSSAEEGPQTWEAGRAVHDEAIAKIVSRILGNHGLSVDELDALSKNLSSQNADLEIPGLGVILTTFHIGNITPIGEVVDSAKKAKLEKPEREKDLAEMETRILEAGTKLKTIEAVKVAYKEETGLDMSDSQLEKAIKFVFEYKLKSKLAEPGVLFNAILEFLKK